MRPCRSPLTVVICVALMPVIADTEDSAEQRAMRELVAAMRGLIEPQFQAATGLRFTSFDCRVGGTLGPGDSFDCDAVDEEGDSIRYTLAVDDEGSATVVLASQPAAGLSDSDLAVLEPPCRSFLDRYGAADWEALLADLHPSLIQATGSAEIHDQLASTRTSLGELRSVTLTTYAHHVSGRHELEYTLDCGNGPGIARLGLLPDDGELEVAYFTVRPAPGTPLHAELLERECRTMVSALIGAPVTAVAAPLEDLRGVGDAVDGTALLEDGGDLAIRFVQHGRDDDFDIVDYKVQMLDVAWMIRRAFTDRPDPSASILCPSPVAPDGGSITCRVDLESGDRVDVTVARRGGDHRIVDVQPVD